MLLPHVTRAQQVSRTRRIGFVAGANASLIASLYSGFLQGMRELGYVDGRDFTVEWRFAEGHYERFDEFARELVRADEVRVRDQSQDRQGARDQPPRRSFVTRGRGH